MNKIFRILLLVTSLLFVNSLLHAETGDVSIRRSIAFPVNGETFSAMVNIDSGMLPLGGYTLDIIYNSSVYNISSIKGTSGFIAIPVNNSTTYSSGVTRVVGTQGENLVTPNGILGVLIIHFQTIGYPSGYSPINIKKISLFDTDATELSSQLDTDNDGISDVSDNSPQIANSDQVDTDGDGIGDASDQYPADNDNDGIEGIADNCSDISNPDQADADNDGLGDLCDPDDDNDGLSDTQELALGTDPFSSDSDRDGYTDGEEISLGIDPLTQNEKADLSVTLDKEFYIPGESALIQTTIANQGIDIVEGNLSLKLVTGKGSIQNRSWSSQSDFQEGLLVNTDIDSNPGQVRLLSLNDKFIKQGTWTAQYDSGISAFNWGELNWTGEQKCLSEGTCATEILFSGSLHMGDGSMTNPREYPHEYEATFTLDHVPSENIRVFVGATSVGYQGGSSVFVNGQKFGDLSVAGNTSTAYSSNYFYISPDFFVEGTNTITVTSNFLVRELDDIWLKDISILEGTQVRFRTRTAEEETALKTAAWSGYTPTSGEKINSLPGRFVEIQAELETSNANETPMLDTVNFSHCDDAETELHWIENHPAITLGEGDAFNNSSQSALPQTPGQYTLVATITGMNHSLLDDMTIPIYIIGEIGSIDIATDNTTYPMEQPVYFSSTINNLEGQPADTIIECTITIRNENGDLVETLNGQMSYINSSELTPLFLSWDTYGRESGMYTYEANAETVEGLLTAEGTFTITNEPPVLVSISDITVNEGEQIVFTPEYSDLDNNTLQISYSGWLNSGSYQTGTNDVGTHTVFITVSDGVLTTTQEVIVTVNNINSPPDITIVPNITVDEGEAINLMPIATDPDGDDVTITYNGWMDSAVYTTGYNDDGIHNVIVTASDGEYSVSANVVVVVKNINRPPVLTAIGSKDISEGNTLMFQLSGEDPDGDALYFDSGNLPTGSMFDSDGQLFYWTPDYGSSGIYPDVLFRVVDSGTPPLGDYEAITIAVGNVNRPPEILPVEDQSIIEGQTIDIVVTATDPDNDNLIFSASNLPSGATFDAQNQRLSWTPDFDQAGNYPDIQFTVTDNADQPLSAAQGFQITVGNINRPPIIDPVGNRSISEGESVQFIVTATDPDGDVLTTLAGNLPEGAVFDDQTKEFIWTPGYDQAGHYDNIYFTAADDGEPSLETTETISITVGDMNRPPVLNPMGDIELNVEEFYEGYASGSDPDGDTLIYGLAMHPDGMTIDPATGKITWTPNDAQQGNHIIQVTVADGNGGTHATEYSVNVASKTHPIRARVRAFPKWLWPPNHKMIPIHVRVRVFNTPDPNPEIALTSITSNELDDEPGTGSTHPDIMGAEYGTPDFKFFLRAERNGKCSGRIYTIVYTITDKWGNTTTAKEYVRVPKKKTHTRKRKHSRK